MDDLVAKAIEEIQQINAAMEQEKRGEKKHICPDCMAKLKIIPDGLGTYDIEFVSHAT